MNFLTKLQATAGQRVHERMYEARLEIFGVEIPCVCAGIINNFQLVEGGKSLRNFTDNLSFLDENLVAALAAGPPDNPALHSIPAREVNILLRPANQWFIPMKLGAGGLLADGLTWRFMAYDRDYGV